MTTDRNWCAIVTLARQHRGNLQTAVLQQYFATSKPQPVA